MIRVLALLLWVVALCAGGCGPVDQRAQRNMESNVQMETGHVDSGGGGGGGM
jgi:hypothetical protein